jgi:hypothetical protein
MLVVQMSFNPNKTHYLIYMEVRHCSSKDMYRTPDVHYDGRLKLSDI